MVATGTISNSELLQTKIQLVSGALHAAVGRLWNHPELARMFLSYLVLAHQIVRASVPLMAAARRRAGERAGADPVCRRLAPYLAHHIEEELAHDEWTLDDLEAAGVARDAVLERIPPPDVAALVGAQYYWIHHSHPVGLLGYMAVLEGYPVTEDTVAELQARTGLPEATFRSYRHHVAVDPQHRSDIDAILDALPLDRRLNGLIGASALHTSLALAACLEALEPFDDALRVVKV